MIKNLTSRERLFLAGGAAALALLILIFGILLPYRSALSSLDLQIEQKKAQLSTVKELQTELIRLKADLTLREQKLARSGSASAFSAIESIVTQLGIRDKLVAMRPQQTGDRQGIQVETVSARIERIDLEQLIRLLKALESSSTLLNVVSMQLKTRFDDSSLLDTELQIETLKRSS